MTDKKRDLRTMTEPEAEAYLNDASEAYHDNPRNPSSCPVYADQNHGMRCPCDAQADRELREAGH
jgi:hypothetical protein